MAKSTCQRTHKGQERNLKDLPLSRRVERGECPYCAFEKGFEAGKQHGHGLGWHDALQKIEELAADTKHEPEEG